MSPLSWALRPYQRYFDFRGRSRRSEFWWFTLFYDLVIIADTIIYNISPLTLALIARFMLGLFFFGSLIPALAVQVRRLHDTDRTGWWALLGFVPVANLFLLYFECQDSGSDNAWGPNPKPIIIV